MVQSLDLVINAGLDARHGVSFEKLCDFHVRGL